MGFDHLLQNFENWPAGGKVVGKTGVSCFLTHCVDIMFCGFVL